MNDPLYAIYGASGCGRGIMPLARNRLTSLGTGAERLVFIDDALKGTSVNGHAVLGYDDFLAADASCKYVAIAIARPAIRAQLAQRCSADGLELWSVQADNVVIMDAVTIGEGALLSPFVTITSNVHIGKCFHANLYSYVEHDCQIGDFVTFAPGVKCNGNVVIENGAYIGAGAVIRQGAPGAPLVIGRGATVGMGAIVTKNVRAGEVVVGNPARPIIKD